MNLGYARVSTGLAVHVPGRPTAGTWLECRVWEEVAPVDRPAQVFIREGTAEWRAWQRHLGATKGKGTPTNNSGGWLFPSKLQPKWARRSPKSSPRSMRPARPPRRRSSIGSRRRTSFNSRPFLAAPRRRPRRRAPAKSHPFGYRVPPGGSKRRCCGFCPRLCRRLTPDLVSALHVKISKSWPAC
jgi:hypothetical protein